MACNIRVGVAGNKDAARHTPGGGGSNTAAGHRHSDGNGSGVDASTRIDRTKRAQATMPLMNRLERVNTTVCA